MIYLDYNATTPLAPGVQQSILPYLAERFGNPSSSHKLGRASRDAIEIARSQVATLIGAKTHEIVFTSGGTESNNLALRGVFRYQSRPPRGHLIVSAIEHPAISQPADELKAEGVAVTVAPSDCEAWIDPQGVAEAIRPETLLVSIMHANNEVGTIQSVREISEICHRSGVLLHTDAAQSIGKIPVNVNQLGVDLLTIAGHKFGAPKGIGALFVRDGTHVAPILFGATQESGLRPGTENVAFDVALGQAAEYVGQQLGMATNRFAVLRDRLLAKLREGIGHDLVLYGAGADRLPNTLAVNFPKKNGIELLAAVPEICALTGAACHSGQASLSPTLTAMGLAPQAARGSVRFSLGWYTTETEIDRAAELLISAWKRMCL